MVSPNDRRPVEAKIELAQKRLKICRKCSKFERRYKRCTECNCFVNYKAEQIEESCPLSKW